MTTTTCTTYYHCDTTGIKVKGWIRTPGLRPDDDCGGRARPAGRVRPHRALVLRGGRQPRHRVAAASGPQATLRIADSVPAQQGGFRLALHLKQFNGGYHINNNNNNNEDL